MQRKIFAFLMICTLALSLIPAAGAEEAPAAVAVSSLGLASVWNDRELGGYVMEDGRQIRNRLLLRSGYLYDAAPEDMEILADQYHVKTIVDLRMPGEVNARPD